MNTPPTNLPQTRDISGQLAKIDEAAKRALVLFTDAQGFEQELALAQAVSDLRAMLTPEVMKPVMALMDSRIGFRTDRDPKRAKKDGPPLGPYSVDVVRDVVIEARMRGFRVVGNELNIIAGGFYATKEGFRRRLTDGRTFPGFSNLRDTYEAPRSSSDGKGAMVKCKATWLLNGVADSIECEIPVRSNDGMGADALLGKAERKLLKRVHDRISGMNTPEGESTEDSGETINVSATEVPAESPRPPAPKETQRPAPPEASASPAGTQASKSPQDELANVVLSAGHTFDDFREWSRQTGNITEIDSLGSFDQVPAAVAVRLLRAKKGLLDGIAREKGVAA